MTATKTCEGFKKASGKAGRPAKDTKCVCGRDYGDHTAAEIRAGKTKKKTKKKTAKAVLRPANSAAKRDAQEQAEKSVPAFSLPLWAQTSLMINLEDIQSRLEVDVPTADKLRVRFVKFVITNAQADPFAYAGTKDAFEEFLLSDNAQELLSETPREAPQEPRTDETIDPAPEKPESPGEAENASEGPSAVYTLLSMVDFDEDEQPE